MSDDLLEEVSKPKAAKKKKKTTKAKSTAKKKIKKRVKEKEDVVAKVHESESKPEKKHISFTSHEKKGKKPSSVFSTIIYVVVLVVVVVAAAGWYKTQQLSKESQNAADSVRDEIGTEVSKVQEGLEKLQKELQQQKADAEKEELPTLLEYSNPQLGIKFSYPQSLGTVQEEVIAGNEETEDDDIYSIRFSANPDLWIFAAGSAYDGDDGLVYAGGVEDLPGLCEEPLVVSSDGYCDTVVVGLTAPTKLEVKPVRRDETLLNVVKTIPLNIRGASYQGLSLNLGLGLPPVTGRSLFAPTDDEAQNEALEDFYRNLIKNQGLSLVLQENLELYQAILDSLEITS